MVACTCNYYPSLFWSTDCIKQRKRYCSLYLYIILKSDWMEKNKLTVLWTTENRDAFLHMIAMYSHNAKKRNWFKEVNILIWGPSSRLASEDKEIQTKILQMIDDGVSVEACKACADIYGVASRLESFGIDVQYKGGALTEYLKSDDEVVLSI